MTPEELATLEHLAAVAVDSATMHPTLLRSALATVATLTAERDQLRVDLTAAQERLRECRQLLYPGEIVLSERLKKVETERDALRTAQEDRDHRIQVLLGALDFASAQIHSYEAANREALGGKS